MVMFSSSQSFVSNSLRKSWAEEVEAAVPLSHQHQNLISTSNIDRSLCSASNHEVPVPDSIPVKTNLFPANNLDGSLNSSRNLDRSINSARNLDGSINSARILEADSVLDYIPINDSVLNTKSAKVSLNEEVLNSANNMGNDSVPLDVTGNAKAPINEISKSSDEALNINLDTVGDSSVHVVHHRPVDVLKEQHPTAENFAPPQAVDISGHAVQAQIHQPGPNLVKDPQRVVDTAIGMLDRVIN
ncbi:uncharacterized protein A4U43_C05F22040 [Asparagus officinalis]|uniref:Uncharacterized protein n=1 Tax=Asparagus officinalis TaxID=4686 RepID=A0A5P1EYX9_ASPOF|nr:uncharacterized protein A4U43_C05F22040 [Asparagus officinalis]